jgi:hypothetical protein
MSTSARNFFLTAISTFIGGIALLIVEPYVVPHGEKLRSSVNIASNDSIALNGPAQLAIANVLKNNLAYRDVQNVGEIDIGFAEITNNGNSDLADLSVKLTSRVEQEDGDFIAAGIVPENETAQGPVIPVSVGKGKEVIIPVSLLKPDEKIQFWYAMSPFNIADISVRKAGLQVSSSEPTAAANEDEEAGFSQIIYILLFSVASFTAGAGLIAATYDNMMKSLGFDLKEFTDAYEAMKKKKESE